VDDQHRIRELHPFVIRETHTEDGEPVYEVLGELLEAYLASLPEDRRILLRRYRVVDVTRKVVGVGSVGTRCWVILLTGADASEDDSGNQGRRVVRGQRMIQGSPDIFLGWCDLRGRHFYVRQLRDMKGGIDITPGMVKPRHFVEYCQLCGWALALAHAKSGDAAQIAGYLGKSEVMDEAIADFAVAYGQRTREDHALLLAAIARGGRSRPAAGRHRPRGAAGRLRGEVRGGSSASDPYARSLSHTRRDCRVWQWDPYAGLPSP